MLVGDWPARFRAAAIQIQRSIVGRRNVIKRNLNARANVNSVFREIFKCESRRIGFLYLASCAAFLLVGATAALVLQFDMFSTSARLVNPQLYGKLLTQHGMMMMFVFLLPLLPGTLGNFVLPAALGAKNLAMPKLNLAGWFCHLIGGILVLVSIELGAYTSGWTMLMPPGVPVSLFGILIFGLFLCACSVLLLGVCILRTIVSSRYRSIPMAQLPLLVWFFFFWALAQILVTPVRLVTLALTMAAQSGGGSVLSLLDAAAILRYRQLFWLYAGPATLATLLPAIGVTFEVLSAQARKAWEARTKLVSAGVGLTILILASWGQHLITAPDQEKLAAIGSLFAGLTAVPILLIVISWLSMMVRTRNLLAVPLTFVWMQIVLLALAMSSTLVLAVPALGIYLHNTYFTVAHLHLVLVGTVLTSFLAGLFHWLPMLTRREYSRRLAYLVAAGFSIGIVATLAPLFLLGTQGSPKGLQTYPEQFQSLHLVSSTGAIILYVSLLLGMVVAIWSCFRGATNAAEQRPDALGGEFSYSQMVIGPSGRNTR